MTKQDQPPLIFVLQPSSSQSQKEKELQAAERKAHAAKVAHARRRHVRGVGQVRQGRAVRRAAASAAGGSRRSNQASGPREDDYWVDETSQEDLPAALLVMSQHTPAPPSQHGSSDPFGSQAIPITPRVNQVLQYATQTLASLFATSYVRRLFSGPWKKYFDPKTVAILHDLRSFAWTWEWSSAEEGSISAYVSMYATSMQRFLPKHIHKEYSMMAFSLRTRSLEVLRKRISDLDGTRQPDMALIMNVMRLFRMDSFAGDVKSARVHANMIRGFAEAVPNLEQKGHFVRMTVYNDVVAATNQLRRPLLDYDNWIQAFMDECKQQIAHYLPPEPQNGKDIHYSVSLYKLRTIMKRLQWYLSFPREAKFAPRTIGDAEMIHRWIILGAQKNTATLLHLYQELTEDDDPIVDLHLTNVALTLTLIMSYQKSMWEAIIQGSDICDSSRVIMPRLERVMRSTLETSTLEELHYYRQAHFWVFFVGAQMEQHKLQRTRPGSSPQQSQAAPHSLWFSNMLVQQARFLNLWAWSDARELVQSFVFNEFWEPSPSIWYENLVQNFSDPTDRSVMGHNSSQAALVITRPLNNVSWPREQRHV
ncbi:uncharacterized protein Z520_08880 [Fonsecaea multimorphosa CBS 102226]|uniref:Uncharacterized protein n=1 Tax=Fonsecaea multimorphosa CBS 102226 TaxID=1442371 RepID=A0A0D2KFA7_9EURO|nr:uncharacterized protein Z520_08880 [Fonsecaea multimorphosa CBS 102226]KIX95363.1 hypothetical protein Z520_08880 [Fonsecaea multimorphosa CBS 102226]OAL21031.1 hypothetical protein AYO22_08315 [Fonsecaea multimorphosa]